MVTTHPSPFGSLLRRYRIAAGLTQEELAERARLSGRAVSDLERGVRRSPYRDTVQQLAEALALGDEEHATLAAAARAGVHGVEVAPEEQAAWSPTNLPDQPTSFIGREREIEQVTGLLQTPHIRLVTLTGPGGTGKTRLALQVGSTLLHGFADGVFLVNLGPLGEPDLVPSTVAGVLGVKEEAGKDLLECLVEHLQDKRLLLVLDNYEHLLEAAAVVSSLLDRCRELHVLTTSRIPLHLSREHEYAVPPLAVPDPRHLPDLAILSQYEAVALFVDRATAVKADFQVTNESAPAVAEICSRLDGLPLAIELAAARIKLFPPQALLQRLSSRLKLLTGGARDLPARQQTLRDTIDWSYSLLSADEQMLFARLSVFAGGCTFEAAEAVCDPEGDLDLVDGLTSLVDKSLLREEGEEEPRFVTLETIREYAAERLVEMGSYDELKEAHARYYLALAEEAATGLEGPTQRLWLERFEGERGNLRSALQWAHDRGDVNVALRLAVALSGFWMVRGPLSIGRRWLDEVVDAEEGRPALRAAALFAAGRLADVEGRRREAADRFERSLALYRDLGDRVGSAEVVGRLAVAWYMVGEAERADELLWQSEIQGRETGNERLLAVSLRIQAAVQGDVEAIQRLGEESLALYRRLDDSAGTAAVLQLMASAAYGAGDTERGRVLTDDLLALLRRSPVGPERVQWLEGLIYQARSLGDYVYALRFAEELLGHSEAVGDRRAAAHARAGLALLTRDQGDYRRADTLYGESLAVFQEVGDLVGVRRALVGLSDVARDQGDAKRVIELCEESLALVHETEDAVLTGYALHNLGVAAWYQGDHQRTERLLGEAFSIFQRLRLGDFVTTEFHVSLGLLTLDRARYDQAAKIFLECLVTVRALRIYWLLGTLLEGTAGVAAGTGEAERAARLFGAAETVRRTIGTPRWPALQSLYDRHLERARTALGEERFLAFLEQGRGMTLEEAIGYALNEVTAS